MVLAIGKVLFQHQEVAAVFAETRGAAPMARKPCRWSTSRCRSCRSVLRRRRTRILRPDREQKTNIYRDEHGATTARARVEREARQAHLVSALPSGSARALRLRGALRHDGTAAVLRHVPGAARLPTALALVTGIPKTRSTSSRRTSAAALATRCRVYPGYVCAVVGALKLGRPVKWIETRTKELTSTGFARDYHMDVELGADTNGRADGASRATAADHGAFDAAADPTKYPAGMFGVVTGSYDIPVAHAVGRAFHQQGAGRHRLPVPFRVTEASYAIERAMDILADELGLDAVELRRRNFIKKEQRIPIGPRLHLRQRRLPQDAGQGARMIGIRTCSGAGGEGRAAS